MENRRRTHSVDLNENGVSVAEKHRTKTGAAAAVVSGTSAISGSITTSGIAPAPGTAPTPGTATANGTASSHPHPKNQWKCETIRFCDADRKEVPCYQSGCKKLLRIHSEDMDSAVMALEEQMVAQ